MKFQLTAQLIQLLLDSINWNWIQMQLELSWSLIEQQIELMAVNEIECSGSKLRIQQLNEKWNWWMN